MDDRLLQLVLNGLDSLGELLNDVLRQPLPVGVSDGEGEVGQVGDGGEIPDGVPAVLTNQKSVLG